jgi:hypothetical protein
MSSKAPKEPLPAAERMRVHRTRRRNGLRCVRILLHETEIDSLIEKGLLNRNVVAIPMPSRTQLMFSSAAHWAVRPEAPLIPPVEGRRCLDHHSCPVTCNAAWSHARTIPAFHR